MTDAARAGTLRLTLARACAWGLLIAGWIGIGALALQSAPALSNGAGSAFALVALWLLAIGAAAAVSTRGGMRPSARSIALLATAAMTAFGLLESGGGQGMPALLTALIGWAVLTALASGVVRSLRLARAAIPAPPIGAASLGALCAGLILGDLADVPGLAARLSAFVCAVAGVLTILQHRIEYLPRTAGCRAGLFDCSLPAWPAGAWHDPLQWPLLLAGLAMLPMMAALPLMAAWCRSTAIAPQAMVLLHLAAMFVPALLLQQAIARWSLRTLSFICAALLASGAALAVWAATPVDLVGLILAQGAAWGLAWTGQLWAPARRGQRNTSPLIAAAGYAALTFAFGMAVEHAGARGVAVVHVALGLAAIAALLFAAARYFAKTGSTPSTRLR